MYVVWGCVCGVCGVCVEYVWCVCGVCVVCVWCVCGVCVCGVSVCVCVCPHVRNGLIISNDTRHDTCQDLCPAGYLNKPFKLI